MNKYKNEPHISYSQLSTYMICPLKYRFNYIEQLEPDFTPAALPFGGAIHESIAYFYRGLLETGNRPSLDDLLDIFKTDWNLRLASEDVMFDKGQTAHNLETLGLAMLQCFYENIQPGEIIAVEAEFCLRKLDPSNGKMLPIPIIGAIDLVERDREGKIICADLKTAARRYQESKIAQDLQLTVYSSALKRSKIVNGASEVHCRFDVLLKTKKPELVQYSTIRNDNDRRRMFKVVNEILTAIEAGVFFPNPGWQCDGCQHKTACDRW